MAQFSSLKAAEANLAKKQNLVEKAIENFRKAETFLMKAKQECKTAEKEEMFSLNNCVTVLTGLLGEI